MAVTSTTIARTSSTPNWVMPRSNPVLSRRAASGVSAATTPGRFSTA
jgi:hypothetical protein